MGIAPGRDAHGRLSRKVSGLTALLDADLLGLGALDLAARREALIAKNAQGFDFRSLACLFAVLEDFEIAWTRHAVFIDSLFPLGHGAPQDQQLAYVLNGCGAQFVGQGLKHGFACCAVVREDPYLDQAVGVQGRISFFLDGGGKPVTAHHHDGVKVMRFGAVYFALGGGQLNLRHAGIIGYEGKNESPNQKQQGQPGVDK